MCLYPPICPDSNCEKASGSALFSLVPITLSAPREFTILSSCKYRSFLRVIAQVGALPAGQIGDGRAGPVGGRPAVEDRDPFEAMFDAYEQRYWTRREEG